MMKLIHGECLEEMAKLPDGCIDMVMTDPPYGTTACKWDSIIPLEPMWEQLKRVIKPNGAIVMTASQPFTTTLISSNMKMFKYEMTWVRAHKSGHLNAKKRPMVAHENVVVFYSKQPLYDNVKHKKSKRAGMPASPSSAEAYRELENQDKYVRPSYVSKDSVISGYAVEDRGSHPTQKPVALMEYLIRTYTNEGETVLDFTMGSGTTGVACANLNREFVGIELDGSYYDVACKRIGSALDVSNGAPFNGCTFERLGIK
jgi:site-specific DNA-methyltransferase (adenine-specific)